MADTPGQARLRKAFIERGPDGFIQIPSAEVSGPSIDFNRHEFQDDDLENFSCSCGRWRYAHVGWGEPSQVAYSKWHNEHVYWRNDW